MSKKVFVNGTKITPTGRVTMELANELHRFLVERLRVLEEKGAATAQVTVDLSEVTEVDACGCQLLALFIESLKRRDITPTVTAAQAPVMEQIEQLGFTELLAGHPGHP